MILIKQELDVPVIDSYKTVRQTRGKCKGKEISKADCEKNSLELYFSDPKNYRIEDNKKFYIEKSEVINAKFKVYKNDDIKKALHESFNGKCAYCETKIGVNANWDIEHFRPKSTVEDDTTKTRRYPGYYWLAADWNNLFPSCQYCNQIKIQEFADAPEELKKGKLDQFPLRDEDQRVLDHTGNLENEEPLLINPRKENPEDFFYFVTTSDNNQLGWAKSDTLKGKTTIEVFALQRQLLVDQRAEHANQLIAHLQRLLDHTKQYELAVQHDVQIWQDSQLENLDKDFKSLKTFLEPDAVFLNLVRQIMQSFNDRGEFERCKAIGYDPMEMVTESIKATELL